MMETCLNDKPVRQELIVVEDLKRDLSEEFSRLSEISDSSQVNGSDDKERLQVYLRVRPFTTTEIEKSESQDCVVIEDLKNVILKAPKGSLTCRQSEKLLSQMVQRFQFSQIFSPDATQNEVFEGTVKPMVKDLVDGVNSLVFTYGVTSAGKTYTLLGPENNAGILPRCLHVLFNTIKDRLYEKMDLKPQRCSEYIRLTKEQRAQEITNKGSVFRLMKEIDSQSSLLNVINKSSRSESISSDVLAENQLYNPERFSLNVGNQTKFSLWVSFCEIYNENIYDLLDPVSNGSLRRNSLRLAQDVKGNPYVKDLKWIQVSDAEEAYKILKLGKKNQSISCTKLNNLSNRSHSIFTIRILRIEDFGVPRVQHVSELSLCDLAGSERCAKTQNKGCRLKEAGNINTSLLILGKCINALRHNQRSKLLQHVPFRESKLTHYFQSFFCGRGKACMIVNINQCASMYDETLNVLKFSSVAQKVVILNGVKPPPIVPIRSAREVSFIIDNADKKQFWRARSSSLLDWKVTLEDVLENDGAEEEEHDKELGETEEMIDEEQEVETIQEDTITVTKESYEKMIAYVSELQNKLIEEKKDHLLLEAKIREEVANEFLNLYEQREQDFSELLEREKEIMEDRAEKRLQILKELVKHGENKEDEVSIPSKNKPEPTGVLDGLIGSLQDDVACIRKQAEDAQNLLATSDLQDNVPDLQNQLVKISNELTKTQNLLQMKTKEFDLYVSSQSQELSKQLEELKQDIGSKNEQVKHLMEMCSKKDTQIITLQEMLDHWEEAARNSEKSLEAVKEKLHKLMAQCQCGVETDQDHESDHKLGACSRKRFGENPQDLEGQPPLKKGADNEECICSCPNIQKNRTEELKKMCFEKDTKIVNLNKHLEQLQQEFGLFQDNVQKEKMLSEELSEKYSKTKKDLLFSEQTIKELSTKLEHQVTCYESALHDLQIQKDTNRNLEDEIENFLKSREMLKKTNLETSSQINIMQEKINKLSQIEDFAKKTTADLKIATETVKKLEQELCEKSCNLDSFKSLLATTNMELEHARKVKNDSHFNDIVEAMRKECEEMVTDASEKAQKITGLTGEVAVLNQKIAELEIHSIQLKEQHEKALKDKMVSIQHLQESLEQSHISVESERLQVSQLNKINFELKDKIDVFEQRIEHLQNLLKLQSEKETSIERKLAEQNCLVENLKESLKKAEDQLQNEAAKHSVIEKKWKEDILEYQKNLQLSSELLASKASEFQAKEKDLLKLESEVNQYTAQIQKLTMDLNRKEEDVLEFKEKNADSRKQLQVVQNEISSKREEVNALKQKLSESERVRNQLISDLGSKERAIMQLKYDHVANQKTEETLQQYQTLCTELKTKERTIQEMRQVMTEQEETQLEQDKVLESKMTEIDCLTEELIHWKQSCNCLGKDCNQNSLKSEDITYNAAGMILANAELAQLKENLKKSEEKFQVERKKWLEEKLVLIKQAKEAEDRRNYDIKRFVEDRDRQTKLQIEIETLTKQLAEKDDNLQKWKQERDELVAALDIQLRNLMASSVQKDQELEKLQKAASAIPQDINQETSKLDCMLAEKDREISLLREQLDNFKNVAMAQSKATIPESSIAMTMVTDKCIKRQSELVLEHQQQEGMNHCRLNEERADLPRNSTPVSDDKVENEVLLANSILDSSEVSTENGRTSRFPKPELEIRFTPLQPNKMAVKKQGRDSSVTLKMTRTAKKRKSNAMEKESSSTQKMSTLKQQASSSSLGTKIKKDGTLQRIGDFLQSSPSLLQNKAKKIIGSLSSPKSLEADAGKPAEHKPKRSRKKLYKMEISSPMVFPPHHIVEIDQEEKESDHLNIKRRLRTRTAKKRHSP
ncbi:kinesin-like protein KIF20B isoform X1 [Polypterus senegalus]|uniref:kinesin-like protein KIF20B isoform X1 n=1 Tax=Polypterus senegalus TaxID=55291 RepID=UPI0019624C2C|nr:kinesin-like protein KIF20B isoform X1 [Polypterus senegalus]